MDASKRMRRIQRQELRKIRAYPRWVFQGFAYPSEISGVRARLKFSGVPFRTEKVYAGGKFRGYKVYVRG